MITEDHIRVPPQSVEAEQAVIGAVMLRPESLYEVAHLISDESFYRRDHRLIFKAMSELSSQDKPLDAVTLGEWFESRGIAEQIGGTGYLVDLASNTPSAANIRAYAEIVREKAQLRKLIEAGTRIVNMGFNPEGESSDELIGSAASLVGDALSVRDDVAVTAKAALKSLYQGIVQRNSSEIDLAGIATGFPDLDELTGGLQGGRLYGIGGRPKMGKSILGKDFAEHAAVIEKKHVAVWTMEMARDEYMSRIVCSHGGIRSKLLQHPKLMDDTDWAKLSATMTELAEAPLTIFDAAEQSVELIFSQARVLKAKGKLQLAVIDYLGLMELPDEETQTLKLGYITRKLKIMAKKLDIPVVILFQLNRGNETGAVRPPRPSDARDSGAIEQDLDCMILLHRPNYYEKDAEPGVRLEVAIQRNGPTGVIRLEDDLERCRFLPSNERWTEAAVSHKRGGKGGSRNEGF